MTKNIWRYSHFALAISSSIFILLATITGLILAFEPIKSKLQGFKISGSETLSLTNVIDTVKSRYDEVLEIEVDVNGFVKASVISFEEELDGDFYINPFDGQKIGDIPPRKPFFEFITNLHRSLFLKTLGRIFVGITSFLLFLIAITGCVLVVKRQNGVRQFFGKIIKEDFNQYFHIITGRWMLIPVLVITITGIYLSLQRFSLIPNPVVHPQKVASELNSTPILKVSQFDIFQQTRLKDIRKLEFPFSEEIEDFYILHLKNATLKINQKTGEIVEELKFPWVTFLSELSFNLHTGAGSIIWSFILILASINILFFMFTGFSISYKRLRTKTHNQIKANDAEFVILVGSENGSTKKFGKLLYQALTQIKQKVFIDELNNYQKYENLKHLVILTSTYGDGDPPGNANKFLEIFTQNPPLKSFQFAVVGFGSMLYPRFCQFAIDIHATLQKKFNEFSCTKSLSDS